jgi:hypothetical protein
VELNILGCTIMKRVFTRWTDAVLFLNKKINNQLPLAGRNITLENTGSGIRIHSKASGVGGSSEYNGYFKVIENDANVIVTDGANPEAEYCGYITVNNSVRPVKKNTPWNFKNVSNGEYTVYIQAYESIYWQHVPSFCLTTSYTESSMRRRLATVTKDGDTITIKQLYEGGGISFVSNLYTGPFAISDISIPGETKSAKVKGGSIRVGGSYVQAPEVNFTISKNVYIYAELKWTGSEYVAVTKMAATIPDEPSGQMHIRIGEVHIIGEGIGIWQSLRDNYTVTGRIV